MCPASFPPGKFFFEPGKQELGIRTTEILVRLLIIRSTQSTQKYSLDYGVKLGNHELSLQM
jgi:hypothetical protein